MNNSPEEISASLRKSLDLHGHSFQYRVIAEANRLSLDNHSKWRFVGSEIPVRVSNAGMHLDFVLEHQGSGLQMVAECKRADPALSHWAFVRSPYPLGNVHSPMLNFDYIEYESGPNVKYGCSRVPIAENIYHLGFELRTNRRGDKGQQPNEAGGLTEVKDISVTKSAINDAVKQVLQASSGYINFEFGPTRIGKNDPFTRNIYLPVIFTTANLWTADDDISAADLKTGHLSAGSIRATQKKWLWFTHNRSQELAHTVAYYALGGIRSGYEKELARSIAIVNSDGIEEFLAQDFRDWTRFYKPR